MPSCTIYESIKCPECDSTNLNPIQLTEEYRLIYGFFYCKNCGTLFKQRLQLKSR